MRATAPRGSTSSSQTGAHAGSRAKTSGGRRVHLLAVEREGRVPGDHDVELLLASVAVHLVVLLDDHAGFDGDVRVHAEAAHVEVTADRMPVVAVPRAQVLDVPERGDAVAHETSSAKRGSSRSGAKSSSSRAVSRSFGSSSSAACRCSSAASARPARLSAHARLYSVP